MPLKLLYKPPPPPDKIKTNRDTKTQKGEYYGYS